MGVFKFISFEAKNWEFLKYFSGQNLVMEGVDDSFRQLDFVLKEGENSRDRSLC